MLGSRVIPKRVAANTRQVPTMPPGTRYRGRALALFLRGGTGRGAALVDNSPERRFLSWKAQIILNAGHFEPLPKTRPYRMPQK